MAEVALEAVEVSVVAIEVASVDEVASVADAEALVVAVVTEVASEEDLVVVLAVVAEEVAFKLIPSPNLLTKATLSLSKASPKSSE